MTFTARQACDTTQHTLLAPVLQDSNVGVQEALARGALSGADVLLWLRVRGRPVIGWVCQHWPAFRRALAPCHALPWHMVLSGYTFIGRFPQHWPVFRGAPTHCHVVPGHAACT